MHFEPVINSALEYTREAFAGRWVRWLIFVILGLPIPLAMTIFMHSFDPEAIIAGGTFNIEQVPWVPIAILFLVGILTAFVLAGYSVRVYRGTVPAPDFTGWASLFIDGIKLDIVALVWMLPAIIMVFFVALTFGLASAGISSFVILAILLLLVEIILVIITILFIIPGTIRFARMGSMIEGWNFPAIRGILGRIGWVNYIIVLVLYVVIAVAYFVVMSIPGMIPYVGWIFPVLTAPFLTVFTARYFTLVYMEGEFPPEIPRPEPVAPAP